MEVATRRFYAIVFLVLLTGTEPVRGHVRDVADSFPIFKGIEELGRRDGHPIDDSGLKHSHSSVTTHSDGGYTSFTYNATMNEACISLDALRGLVAVEGCGSFDADSITNPTQSKNTEGLEHLTLHFTAKGAEVSASRLRPGAFIIGSSHWHCGGAKMQVAHVIHAVSEIESSRDIDGHTIVRVVTRRGHFGQCFDHLRLRFVHVPASRTVNDLSTSALNFENSSAPVGGKRNLLWGGSVEKEWDVFNVNYNIHSRRASRELTPNGASFVTCANCYLRMSAGISISIDVDWLDVKSFTVKTFGSAEANLEAFINQPESQETWALLDLSQTDLVRINLLSLGISFASVHFGVDIDGQISFESRAITDDLLQGRFDYSMSATADVEFGVEYTSSDGFRQIRTGSWSFDESYTNTLELGSVDATLRLRSKLIIETYPLYYRISHTIIPYVRARMAFGMSRPNWADSCTAWYDPSVNIRYGMLGETQGSNLKTPSDWKWCIFAACTDWSDKTIINAAFGPTTNTWLRETDLATFCLSEAYVAIFNSTAAAIQLSLRASEEFTETSLIAAKKEIARILEQPVNRVWIELASNALSVQFAPSITMSTTPSYLADRLLSEFNDPLSTIYASIIGGSLDAEDGASQKGMLTRISVRDPDSNTWYLCATSSGGSYTIKYTQSVCSWRVFFFQTHIQLKIDDDADPPKCIDAYRLTHPTMYRCENSDDNSDDQFWLLNSDRQIVSRNAESAGKCISSSSPSNVIEGQGLQLTSCTNDWTGKWSVIATTTLFDGANRVSSTDVFSSQYTNPLFGNKVEAQVRYLYTSSELRLGGLKSNVFISGLIVRGGNLRRSKVQNLRISEAWISPSDAKDGVTVALTRHAVQDFWYAQDERILFRTSSGINFVSSSSSMTPWDGQSALLLEFAHDMTTADSCTAMYGSGSPCGYQQLVQPTTAPLVRGAYRQFPSGNAGTYPWTDDSDPVWYTTAGNLQNDYQDINYVADIQLNFCLPGFFRTYCDTFCDKNLTCNMRGRCAPDGTCVCDDGYSGSDCRTVDKTCDGKVVISATSSTYPSYPFTGKLTDGSITNEKYGNNANCTWNVKLPGARAVRLTMVRFSTEENFDYVFAGPSVFLRNAPDNRRDAFYRMLEVSGELANIATPLKQLTMPFEAGVSDDSLETGFSIHFISDYSVRKSGWEFQWDTIYCFENDVMGANRGRFAHSAPLSSENPGSNCSWTISPAFATHVYALHLDIDLSCGGSNEMPITVLGDENGDGVREMVRSLSCTNGSTSVVVEASSADVKLETSPGWLGTTMNVTYESVYCKRAGPDVISDANGEVADSNRFEGVGYWLVPERECSWTIQVPGAKFISWELVQYNISLADQLRIYDGPDATATQFSSYRVEQGDAQVQTKHGCTCTEPCTSKGWCETLDGCGQIDGGRNDPGANRIFTWDVCRAQPLMRSAGNSVHIQFDEREGATDAERATRSESSGWLITYIAGFCDGRETLTEPRGKFSDGSPADRFHSPRAQCEWLIKVPGAQKVDIEFIRMDTEEGHDNITIYSGDSVNESRRLYTFSGNLSTLMLRNEGSAHVVVEDEQVLITFSGDDFDSKYGFEIMYSVEQASPSDLTSQSPPSQPAWVEHQKLTNANWSSGDDVGEAVSISGDYAVVGAPKDNANGAESGSAYVFCAFWGYVDTAAKDHSLRRSCL